MLEHPLRNELNNELHARPFEPIHSPELISYYAMLTGEDQAQSDREHVIKLCDRFGLNPPAQNIIHFYVDLGPFRLKWERHSEFSTYTFFRHCTYSDPFNDSAANYIPKDWLDDLPGERLVATHIAFMQDRQDEPSVDDLSAYFVSDSLSSSLISSSNAQVWTDFRIHADGYSRYLLLNKGISPNKAGRVIQRLIEIETYRTLALLALPIARSIGPKTIVINNALAELTLRIAENSENDDANQMLHELSDLSANLEKLSSTNAYRFSASRAYYTLMQTRLDELDEQKISGYLRLSAFLDRRMAPAMRTCEAISNRLVNLSTRATRTANLLRTRVDIAMQGQNQDRLSAMAKHSKMQLRMQETVEGLSVAAITYYAVGLVAYLAKAIKALGVDISIEITTGLSIPIIATCVWAGVRQIRRHILRDEKDDNL